MLYKIFSSLALLFISLMATSQTLQTWTWDTYKMKFSAPDNLVVQKNDATVYEAGNSAMYLDIYPRTGENLTYDGMKNSLIKWANDTGLSYDATNSDGATQPIYLQNLNGYWGCAIDGKNSNGLPASIMLIVDPNNSSQSFYISINYQAEYYHDAVNVLKSFTPM